MMELDTSTIGRTVVLHCTGRLNMASASTLRSLVDATILSGSSRVVVDLSRTTFIDSSGLGALVGGLKSARHAGGDLRIAGATEQVLTVLRLTNLDRVLTPHPSVEDASRGW